MASGYKWGDLEDTRAALLVHTSKSWMRASPQAKCSTVRGDHSQSQPRHDPLNLISKFHLFKLKGIFSPNQINSCCFI